jgi:hypothetical protein
MRASFSPNACHRRENKIPIVRVRAAAERACGFSEEAFRAG